MLINFCGFVRFSKLFCVKCFIRELNFRAWSQPRNYFNSETFPIYGSSTWRQITPLTFVCLAALVLRDPIPWLIEEVILIPLHCYMGVAIDPLL